MQPNVLPRTTFHLKRLTWWLPCGLATVAAASTCDTQAESIDHHEQPNQTLQNSPAVTTLAGQIELARLVDLAAQRLKLNIEYDAAALKSPVTLRLEAGLSDDEIWLLVNRVLVSRGFTTVRMPGKAAFSVVKIQDAPALAGASVELPMGVAGPPENLAAPHQYEPIAGFTTATVRARHRTPKDLVEQVNKLLSKGGASPSAGSQSGGAASAIGDTGLILIADLQPRVERAVELFSLLDAPGAETVVREVELKNLSASQMALLLGQVSAKQEAVSGERAAGDVLPTPDGRSLLIVAPESGHGYWAGLIAELDKREELITRTYTPRSFEPDDVAHLIEQTVRDGGAGGLTAASVAGNADPRWRLVVDSLTGSLVITATPAQHMGVDEVLARLEAAPASARRPVRSFVIKNRPVAEIRQILEELLRAGILENDIAIDRVGSGTALSNHAAMESSASGGEARSAGSTAVTPMPLPAVSSPRPLRPGSTLEKRPEGPSGDGPSSPTFGGGGQGRPIPSSGRGTDGSTKLFNRVDESPLVMTADEGTNTLIAIGEPRLLAQIELLIKSLDVRQPQVMLEVLMVTLSEDQSMSLGVEIEELTFSNEIKIRLSSLFGLGVRNAAGDRDGPLNASGLTGVVLSPGDFSVIVRALERINNGRSVSMPKLLVGNNQQASINSVVQQPFASVNASNTVSTTSFGGTSDAGTVVTIRPQIAEGDHMNLDYSVSLSSFVGAASDPTLPPPRQENQVQSVATIPDGHTVVVGGIEVESQSKSISQIPGLGSIPVVGEAFKSRAKSSSRSRFFVFIRANILRSRGVNGDGFEALRYVSSQDADSASVEDGFPDVQPRVIR